MQYIPQIIFTLILIAGVGYFSSNVKKLFRNIKLGKAIDVSDNKPQRWTNMAKIALGQTKMVVRPIAGFLHIIVYVGFIIINIEVLEIVIDGIFGTHRIGLSVLNESVYGFLIGSFEILAVLVLIAVFAFWIRRNIIKIKSFLSSEMTGWPKNDGNIILYFEVVLMCLFLFMNATDTSFQNLNSGNVVSQFIAPFFDGMSENSLHMMERTARWLDIIGILVFLNYFFKETIYTFMSFFCIICISNITIK